MAGTVINDRFQAQFGFESPKYTVDTAGKVTAETLDVKSILLNGKAFVQAAAEDQTSDGGFLKSKLLARGWCLQSGSFSQAKTQLRQLLNLQNMK